MAKNIHAVIDLQGTLGGLVFVNNIKHGKYVRAARGTFKKAKCNHVLKVNSSRTALLNAAASPLYHFLKAQFTPFFNGNLWPDLLSRMRGAEKNDMVSLMMTLEGLELHERYKFDKLAANLKVTVSAAGKKILVAVSSPMHPVFTTNDVNCYYYDVVIVFFDEKIMMGSDTISTEWVNNTDEPPAYELVFTKPPKARSYLLLVKVQGGHNHTEGNSYKMVGAKVMKAGKC